MHTTANTFVRSSEVARLSAQSTESVRAQAARLAAELFPWELDYTGNLSVKTATLEVNGSLYEVVQESATGRKRILARMPLRRLLVWLRVQLKLPV